ncbi:uncharacterized protein LOC141618312 [Silene latifolia]|uniref:uncharacterized protein LOC141618312 n=1 Tax=Silene latifolia TaxID=37657 RepID=UPI003D773D0C
MCLVRDTLRGGYAGDKWGMEDKEYTIQAGYNWLAPALEKVVWAPLVWLRLVVSKHNFITWLAVQSRLLTRDRLSSMGICCDIRCLLCGEATKTHFHLFFECIYSQKCVQLVSDWLKVTIPWQNTLDWWNQKRIKPLLRKHIVGATVCALVYHVWQARNRCLHDHSVIRPSRLVLSIKSCLCTR